MGLSELHRFAIVDIWPPFCEYSYGAYVTKFKETRDETMKGDVKTKVYVKESTHNFGNIMYTLTNILWSNNVVHA